MASMLAFLDLSEFDTESRKEERDAEIQSFLEWMNSDSEIDEGCNLCGILEPIEARSSPVTDTDGVCSRFWKWFTFIVFCCRETLPPPPVADRDIELQPVTARSTDTDGVCSRFWKSITRIVCCCRETLPPPPVADRDIDLQCMNVACPCRETLPPPPVADRDIELQPIPDSKLEDMVVKLQKDEEIAFFNQARVDFLSNFFQLLGQSSENQFAIVFAEYLMKVFGCTACHIWKMEVGRNKNILNVELLLNKMDDILTLIKFTPHDDVIEAARQSRCAISVRAEDISLEEQHIRTGLFYSNPVRRGGLSQAMLVPLLEYSGDSLYVIEVFRENLYSVWELQVANSCCVWGSMALSYYMGMVDKKLQSDLTVHLIATLKCVFQEMLSLDVVIQRILKCVQQLVNADRASLFMLDRAKNELVSTVFDQKLDGDSREKREIRIPMDRGIAGLVATTGELMNIPDAYKDLRFNREVDEATGYKTTSILCMPVKVHGEIIGVVQMVNKRNANCFYRNDIYAFDVFESFFGLALHHAKLYETIVRSEQKYKVALEVLSYHNTCKNHEVEDLLALEPHKVEHILDDYYLDPYSLNAKKKCQAVIIMFDDLFGMTQFDSIELTRFTLTVMKNYRNVPYHNFDHGWAVAQTMYAILKNDTDGHFNNKQRLALFVASLCHDLDHRGYTNKYMSEIESPLAAMYTTSTLEHHHFNTTVRILQQEGHNIFSKFSGEEYTEILSLMRICILATDLAVFYQNISKVRKIIFIQRCFDWSSLIMQEYAMALSMTAADLSASAKPWDVQMKTVLVIVEEFYTQGDKESAAGRAPIAMMDRNRPEQLPISQVGFLTTTCIPCYKMLKYILPGTINLYSMAKKNLKFWEEQVKEKEKETSEKKPTATSSSII